MSRLGTTTPHYPNPRRLLLIAVFGAALGSLIWVGASSREPVYDGEPLSHWLEQFRTNHFSAIHHDLDIQAESAIRHLGTNIEPILLRMMATTASPTRLKLLAKIPKPWLTHLHLSDANAYRRQVADRRRLGA